MNTQQINKLIDEASSVIGKTFPLYAFVTSNPLSGYEKESFLDATQSAQKYFGGTMFPKASVYKQALANGEIDTAILKDLLLADGFTESPEVYLRELESQKSIVETNINHTLDAMMAKWLAAFLDEGMAEWEMPNREQGFFFAWKNLAVYDGNLKLKSKNEIPTSTTETLAQALQGFDEKDYKQIFEYHIAALAGWAGYIKFRVENNTEWQQKHPISLHDYLAVRLWVAKKLDAQIITEINVKAEKIQEAKLQYVWLKAWEKSLQTTLTKKLAQKQSTVENMLGADAIPDVQLVFCIDTRSELIRRHIEGKANYETFGFAGFFGIAADYEELSTGVIKKSCPPIVGSAYKISETASRGKNEELVAYQEKATDQKFKNYFFKRLKNMLPSAFGFVEGAGLVYGASLVARSLFPGALYKSKQKNADHHESFCDAHIAPNNGSNNQLEGIPLNEKVAIVNSAFAVMGWTTFAPLVVFAGHGSHSANNAFGSSLDCGACAASPGRNNARMLASLANLPEVKEVLSKDFGLNIPSSTVFIGAEHNTTTEEIVLFDSHVPATHKDMLNTLKLNLLEIQKTAVLDRRGITADSLNFVHKKANNWAETRPEWGLAKNGGFIIGPRSLSKHVNLDSRCFLQSYDWKKDETGALLEAVMQGPMTVTQWINNHYYFSTVDNDRFGGGSKITHNVTGQFGVVQGNGGDLKIGIPLQSVKAADDKIYHQPLRLSVIIEAPLARITEILERNPSMKNLIVNEWIYLLVMDPSKDGKPVRYSVKQHLESAIKTTEVPLAALVEN